MNTKGRWVRQELAHIRGGTDNVNPGSSDIDVIPIIGKARFLVLLVARHHRNHVGEPETCRKRRIVGIVPTTVAGSDDYKDIVILGVFYCVS
jgi:hypothetical protein